MPDPLISVVICVYNGEGFLAKALDSVLSQTYPRVEIVVVDDGSVDGSASVIRDYAARHACIRPFFRANHGLPASRNFAFANASGEWIAIIDQDDLCYPARLERQLATAVANPGAELIFCNTHFIDEHDVVVGDHLSKFRLPERFIAKKDAGNLLLKVGCFIDSEAFFMKRQAALSLGPMDEALPYACDYEFFIRAGLAVDFAYTTEILSAWRVHADQATATSPKIRHQVRGVYRRYFWAAGVTWATRLVLLANMAKSYAGQLRDGARKVRGVRR